ncbi:MAG: aminoacyl-tRNA hydrolase [Candidatus Saccharimonadales bacterium]
MKLIFAQGNPGDQYATSRHNVGFMTLDQYAADHSVVFVKKPKFHADIAEITIRGDKVLLIKPTTFYNETGQSARLLVDFYKVDPVSDILVVHDDLSLPLGTLRIRQKGSDAGNNGIKSFNAHLGPDYYLIRVGVCNPLRDKMDDAKFVLSPFSRAEMKLLTADIIPATVSLLDAFCADTLQTTSQTIVETTPPEA